MYSILQKEDAGLSELVNAYVEIEGHAETLREDQKKLHNELIEAKLNGKSKRDIAGLRTASEDVTLDVEAAERALSILYERMEQELPGAINAEINEVKMSIQVLHEDRQALKTKMLRILTDFFILRENLSGYPWNVRDADWVSHQLGSMWTPEDKAALLQKIASAKAQSSEGSLERRVTDCQRRIRILNEQLSNQSRTLHTLITDAKKQTRPRDGQLVRAQAISA